MVMKLLETMFSRKWERLQLFTPPTKLDGCANDIIKLVLLGNFGKSTKGFANALTEIFRTDHWVQEYTDDTSDAISYRNQVRRNAASSMIYVVKEVGKVNEPCYSTERITNTSNAIRYESQISQMGEVPKELWTAFKRLWEDTKFQKSAKDMVNADLYEEAERYFESINRITATTYVPSTCDITLCRLKLKSVMETPLKNKLWLLEIPEVTSRCRAKNVLQFFDKNTVLLLTVDLSSYDQLESDGKTNSLMNTLEQCKFIAQNDVTQNAAIVMVFTNEDLFKVKLRHKYLKRCFRNYSGSRKFKEGFEYVVGQFESQFKMCRSFRSFAIPGDRPTSKTDMKLMKTVLSASCVRLRCKEMNL